MIAPTVRLPAEIARHEIAWRLDGKATPGDTPIPGSGDDNHRRVYHPGRERWARDLRPSGNTVIR